MTFSIGDIVMLKDPSKYKSTYVNPLNLFKIQKVLSDGYILNNIGRNVAKDDVISVPIDGIHDKKIYYYYAVAADVYWTEEEEVNAKPKTRDMRYYVDAIKDFPDLYQRVKGLSFVHEVQLVIKKGAAPLNDLKIDNY